MKGEIWLERTAVGALSATMVNLLSISADNLDLEILSSSGVSSDDPEARQQVKEKN